MLKILLVISCLVLSSCMVGPNYKEPKKNIAPHWLKNGPGVRAAPIRNANWWQAFHDPTLTSLIQQGYFNNLSLQVAGVRVLQARAQLAQAVGELYPQQQNMGGVTLLIIVLAVAHCKTFYPTNLKQLPSALPRAGKLIFGENIAGLFDPMMQRSYPQLLPMMML